MRNIYKKFDLTYDMREILDNPGVWIELEYDKNTGIWEKNGSKYFVTLNNKVIDVKTGSVIKEETVNNFAEITLKSFNFRWLYVYKLDEYN